MEKDGMMMKIIIKKYKQIYIEIIQRVVKKKLLILMEMLLINLTLMRYNGHRIKLHGI